ncbi:MAG: FG-GAP-like repeat-containing protein [Pirellulaceae bacterium]
MPNLVADLVRVEDGQTLATRLTDVDGFYQFGYSELSTEINDFESNIGKTVIVRLRDALASIATREFPLGQIVDLFREPTEVDQKVEVNGRTPLEDFPVSVSSLVPGVLGGNRTLQIESLDGRGSNLTVGAYDEFEDLLFNNDSGTTSTQRIEWNGVSGAGLGGVDLSDFGTHFFLVATTDIGEDLIERDPTLQVQITESDDTVYIVESDIERGQEDQQIFFEFSPSEMDDIQSVALVIPASIRSFDGQIKFVMVAGSQTNLDLISPPLEADLVIEKSAPPEAVAGRDIQFTITATNQGPDDAVNARVIDIFSNIIADNANWICTSEGGASCPISGVGNLDALVSIPASPDAKVTFVVNATIPSNATGVLQNETHIIPPDGFKDPDFDPTIPDDAASTNADQTTTNIIIASELSIEKRLVDSIVVAGDLVRYRVQVRNDGPSDAIAIITDAAPDQIDNVEWTCIAGNCANATGNLLSQSVEVPANSIVEYEMLGTVQSTARGILTNAANVELSNGMEANLSDNEATVSTPINVAADLQVRFDVATAVAGQTTEYEIVFLNTGPSDLTDAPIAVEFQGIDATNWTCVTAICPVLPISGSLSEVVDLPAGEEIRLRTSLSIPSNQEDDIVYFASGSVPPDTVDPNINNNILNGLIDVEHIADLRLTTELLNTTTLVAGTTFQFQIEVANDTGPSDLTARISDMFSPSVSIDNISWICTTTGIATCDSPSGTGTIDHLIQIPVGESVLYTVDATLAPDAMGQITYNVNSIPVGFIDPIPENNDDAWQSTIVRQANLSVTTSAPASPPPSESNAGSEIHYSYLIQNTGPSDASDLTLRDAFAALLESTTWSCSPAGTATCPFQTPGQTQVDISLPAESSLQFFVTGVVPILNSTRLEGLVSIVSSTTNLIGEGPTSLQLTTDVLPPNTRISGVVFDDMNGNGLREDNELGLAGRIVRLAECENQTTLTDEFGNYSFVNISVSNSSCVVSVDRPTGWAQTMPTGSFAQDLSTALPQNAKISTAVVAAEFDANHANDEMVVLNELFEDGYRGIAALYSSANLVNPLQARYQAGVRPQAMTPVDFDADGDLDIAIANVGLGTSESRGSLQLFENVGGQFAYHSSLPAGNGPIDVIRLDLDQDGIQDDLAVVSFRSAQLHLYENRSGTAYSLVQSIAVGALPTAVDVGDFNNDGLDDVVVANSGANRISFILSRTDSDYFRQDLDLGFAASEVAVGDFDSNGQPEIAVGHFQSNPGQSDAIVILSGLGNGEWNVSQRVEIAANSGVKDLLVADLDADSDSDLAIAQSKRKQVSIFTNNGQGEFTESASMPSRFAPIGLAAGYLNDDGNLDLIVAESPVSAGTRTMDGATIWQHHAGVHKIDLMSTPIAVELNFAQSNTRGAPVQQESASEELSAGPDRSTRSLDVNGDGFVSPIDALVILNSIDMSLDFDERLDIDSDSFISAVDALFVINELNQKT